MVILTIVGINSRRSEVDLHITPTVETLARNKSFQQINKLLISYLNKYKNFTELKKISNKTSLSSNDEQILFINMGFQDLTDFTNFQNDLIMIMQNVRGQNNIPKFYGASKKFNINIDKFNRNIFAKCENIEC